MTQGDGVGGGVGVGGEVEVGVGGALRLNHAFFMTMAASPDVPPSHFLLWILSSLSTVSFGQQIDGGARVTSPPPRETRAANRLLKVLTSLTRRFCCRDLHPKSSEFHCFSLKMFMVRVKRNGGKRDREGEGVAVGWGGVGWGGVGWGRVEWVEWGEVGWG